jgi:hypothetical protein
MNKNNVYRMDDDVVGERKEIPFVVGELGIRINKYCYIYI